MRTKLLIITATIACTIFHNSFAQVSQYSWEYVRSIQDEYMQKVCTQGLDTLFVVGQKGLIAKSTDRALTWTKQHYKTNVTLNDIIFINNNTGFAVGEKGTILKTIDGGVNWTPEESGTFYNLNAVAATSLNKIWAVGDSSIVVLSTDSGKTWTAQNLLPVKTNLNDIRFKGSVGYISGNNGTVFQTTNSGINWENNSISWKPEIQSSVFGIHSLSITENKVYALLYNDYPAYGTGVCSEGFGNWSICKDINGSSISGGSIYYLDNSIGYYAAYDWTSGSGWGLWIFKTLDAGKNWEQTGIQNNLNGQISQYSSFSFVKDNPFGYFICGQIMLRTPYNGDFTTKLVDIKQNQQALQIIQKGDELQLKSTSKIISEIEIFSLSGNKIYHKKSNSVNIHQIPYGGYLINAVYLDNSKSKSIKWIRR